MSQTPSNPTAPALKAGDQLDKFEIVEQIGAGGMSVVWKGYDRLLDRFVAIKQIILDTGGDPAAQEELVAGFRREASLQRSVSADQKHLVHVIDFFEEPRGLFIVMEYVAGPSLEQILAQTPRALEPKQALGIVGATALALQVIHGRGVIHRDLKPSNILLPREGGLKVGDFGLATLAADQEALAVGSVRYMAPELFRNEPVDARADVYALGLIAYEMLAGRAKFEEAFKVVLRDQRNQALRWMKWHTNLRAKAPPLAQLCPEIPAALSELVERMMEKEPAKRIGSARELLKAIRRHFGAQEGAGKTAVAPKGQVAGGAALVAGSAEQTAPLPKPRRWPWLVAAAAVLLLVTGGGWWIHHRVQRNDEAQAAAQRVREEATQRYQEARRDLEAGKFAEAAAAFGQLARSGFGKTARALELFSRGRQDLEAGRYAAAMAALTEADAALVDASKLGPVKDLSRDLIKQFKEETESRERMDKVVAQIEVLLAKKNFAQARADLQDMLRLRSLTQAERSRLEDLGARIEAQQTQAKVAEVVQKARAQMKAGRRNEARKDLEREERREPKREYRELMAEIDQENDYVKAMGEGRRAEGDREDPQHLAKAIAAYEQALSLKPEDTKLAAKLKQLQAEEALDRARQARKEGRQSDAERAYTQALGYVDSAVARQELAQVRSASEKEVFVRAAETAAAGGDFEAAIKHYQSALALGEDPQVAAKLVDVQARASVRQGQQALRAGRLEEARAAFVEAERLSNNTSTEAKEGLDLVTKRQAYLAHRDKGDAYRQEGRFLEAKLEYLRAAAIRELDEIKQRLDDVEYESLVANAQRDMAAKNWSAARGWLRTAAKARDTEQVRKLMEEVDRQDPQASE